MKISLYTFPIDSSAGLIFASSSDSVSENGNSRALLGFSASCLIASRACLNDSTESTLLKSILPTILSSSSVNEAVTVSALYVEIPFS